MATNSNIREQTYQFFLEEAPELLQTIESGLLTLRQGRDMAEIHQIMRAAHSLKGGAASVGLDPIKAIAHRLETLFRALYSETLAIDSDLEQQLLQAFDCLRLPLTAQLAEGHFDAEQALSQAEPILERLETQFAVAIAETENFIPGSEELGFNMATSIFDVDVQQGLDHLVNVLENPSAYEVAGELRAQAEVFIGFAELLDLPGFAHIAETALVALDGHPDRVIEITRLAVEDFRQGRTEVLSQAATEGGTPSADLVALAQSADAGAVETTADSSLQDDSLQDLSIEPSFTETDAIAELLQIDPHNERTETEEIDLSLFIDPVADPSEISHATGASQALEALFVDSNWGDLSPADVPVIEQPQEISDAVPSADSTEQVSVPEGNGNLSTPDTFTVTLPSQSAPLVTGLTVRVDTQRLADMDKQVGELTINRNGLALQTNQMRLGLKELMARFGQARSTVEQLQAISDQILVAPERQRSAIAADSPFPLQSVETISLNGFDSLEMDTYTALYTYTQTLLEDMMQIEEAVADLNLFNRQSEQLLGQHRKMLSQVQDNLMYARMIPVSQVLNRFPRALRDLSHTYGKPAELSLDGMELLVDKAVLEKLYDPLLHLLRNAFAHGLESPAERQQSGKPETGQITIRASYRGRQVVIDVQDDGRGLDVEQIRQQVVNRGLMTPEAASNASATQLSGYIFEPRFSTVEQADDLSGRGVGLDVVREELRLLKGTVTVQSIAGKGTRFTLSLPMTLSIVNLLVCFIGSTPIAFRSDSISEILVPQSDQLVQVQDQWQLILKQQSVPVYRLSNLLPYQCLLPEMPLSRILAAVPSPTDWESPVLILTRGDQSFAIQVDRLVTEQESVIKPFNPALTPPPYAYGCTVLGDGSLIPVIDGQVFLDDLLKRTAQPADHPTDIIAAIADQNRNDDRLPLSPMHQLTTVLVVDDAVTSRRTLSLSLEKAGYRVIQARDGQEALEQLQQNPAVRLIVCDVEMPTMNGFEFLKHRRQTPTIAQIPTIMLTSRSNDKHRWLAMHLGATDYFSKPYLEQEFMAAIAQQIQPAQTSV